MEGSVIGSMSPDSTVSLESVFETLSFPVEINSGGSFIGKPGTRLFASDSHVLKLQNQHSMECKEAQLWCERQLARERDWNIYHPSRSWVVLKSSEGCATANITRRLPTLASQLQDEKQPARERLRWLLRLFSFYFHFVERHQLRQDEGLTNYGIDQDRLWYLDDDIYRLDNGLGFAHTLGGFLRSLDFISPVAAEAAGRSLREHAKALGRNGADILRRNLMDTFLPEDREPLRRALLRGLGESHKPARTLDRSRSIAVIADIHGNLAALDAVLADIKQCGVEQLLVLGDIVGYGPEPGACVDRLRHSNAVVIRGNHDQAAADGQTPQGFSRAASWSVPWTWQRLNEEQRHWLAELPLFYRDEGVLAVHGAPVDPTFMNAYVYAMTSDRNLDYMDSHKIATCFHGHSHIAGCWWRDRSGQTTFSNEDSLNTGKKTHRLVCPGSVGQPRDGKKGASYLIWSPKEPALRWQHVDYDHDAFIARMTAMEFPDFVLRLFQS